MISKCTILREQEGVGPNQKARKGASVSDPDPVNPEPDPGSFSLSSPDPSVSDSDTVNPEPDPGSLSLSRPGSQCFRTRYSESGTGSRLSFFV